MTKSLNCVLIRPPNLERHRAGLPPRLLNVACGFGVGLVEFDP